MKTALKKYSNVLLIFIISSLLSGCNQALIKAQLMPKLLLLLYNTYIVIKPWTIVVAVLSFFTGLLAKLIAKKTPTIRKIGLFMGMIGIPLLCFLAYYGIPAILSNNYEYIEILK